MFFYTQNVKIYSDSFHIRFAQRGDLWKQTTQQLHLIKLVIKKIEKQCSAAQISEILEEPLDIIQQIYDIALLQAPDYNADKILKELISKTVS